MRAITILNRCRNAEGEMRRIRQRIEQRRDAAIYVSPSSGGVGGGRGASSQDKMPAFVAAIDELQASLDAREQARRVEVAAACVYLDNLPEYESAVLHQYYIKGQKVPSIAKHMGYTEGYIRKLKSDGEKSLDDLPEATIVAALPVWYVRERGKY